MKSFILKFLLFSFIFFLFDKFFLLVLNYNPQIQVDNRLEFVLKGEMNKDIIVLGSSRGARDIIAGQLQKETGLSAYNLCYPGSDIEFHEFIFRSLLKFNQPPKIIILPIDDPEELLASESITFRYEILYPFMIYDQVLQEMIKRKEKEKLPAELLVLYRMNKSNFDLKQNQFSPYDSLMTCGSMPANFKSERDFQFNSDSIRYNREKEVPEKILAFQKLITGCIENNIKLIVLFPPNFKNHNIIFEKRIKSLLPGQVYTYIYNRDNPVYKDKSSYFDESHLILEYSKIFTTEVSSFISTLK